MLPSELLQHQLGKSIQTVVIVGVVKWLSGYRILSKNSAAKNYSSILHIAIHTSLVA